MKRMWQVLLLIGSFLAVFVWQQTALSLYTLQALGVLMMLLIILSIKRKRISVQDQGINPFAAFGEDSPWTIFLFNTIVLLFVFATGGITSGFFFLLYFLGFGVAFFLEPSIVFVFTIGTMLIFIPQAIKDDVVSNIIRLASLGLITPLSYFFGRGYKDQATQEEKTDTLKQKTNTASKAIKTDIADVLAHEKDRLFSKDKQKLEDALTQTGKIEQEFKK